MWTMFRGGWGEKKDVRINKNPDRPGLQEGGEGGEKRGVTMGKKAKKGKGNWGREAEGGRAGRKMLITLKKGGLKIKKVLDRRKFTPGLKKSKRERQGSIGGGMG